MSGHFADRTALLIGGEGVAALAAKRVAVFGVGGVGGAVCEALARAGVGALDIVDDDVVAESNLNRQIIALRSTLGQRKVDVMARRVADINPDCRVAAYPVFVTGDNMDSFPVAQWDYVVDAVDTVTAKLAIIERARGLSVPVISAMGAGNKLHPESFEIALIEKTSGCPLARVMRRELKKRGIRGVKVVYSREMPLPLREDEAGEDTHGGFDAPEPGRPGAGKKRPPGSISFVPGAAGFVLAGEVVREMLGNR